MDLQKGIKTMVHFIWHVMAERLSSLLLAKVGIHFGHVRMCATPYPISWIIFILDLGPSYTDKLRTSRSCFFYTATKEISWILVTMITKLMSSRLLIPLLGTSITF